MCNRPKISVIVLIYNVEQFIEKCVESLYKQTLDSIEYIFVDDCSTDNSIDLLKAIMAKNPGRAANSTIITNKTNLGQAKSRYNALMRVRGEYVIFCDSDDYVSHDAYKTMYDHIVSTNSDIVACDFYRVYDNTFVIDKYSGKDTPLDWIRNILLSNKMGSLWCHLIKKELFDDLLCPKANIMEDVVILTQCLTKAEKVYSIQQPLYYYIYRYDSITNRNDKILNQAVQMNANLTMISSLLKDYQTSLEKEIESKFFFIKKWLFPIINTAKDCSAWINFSSVVDNYKIMHNPYISSKDKLIVLLIYLRLYPLVKKFKNNNQ